MSRNNNESYNHSGGQSSAYMYDMANLSLNGLGPPPDTTQFATQEEYYNALNRWLAENTMEEPWNPVHPRASGSGSGRSEKPKSGKSSSKKSKSKAKK